MIIGFKMESSTRSRRDNPLGTPMFTNKVIGGTGRALLFDQR